MGGVLRPPAKPAPVRPCPCPEFLNFCIVTQPSPSMWSLRQPARDAAYHRTYVSFPCVICWSQYTTAMLSCVAMSTSAQLSS